MQAISTSMRPGLNASKGLDRARNRNWCARNFPALVEETEMAWMTGRLRWKIALEENG
jgi:hypothetical protein